MLGVPFNFAAKAPTPTAMLTFPLKPSVPTLMQCCSVLCLTETTLNGLFPIQTGILFSTFVYFVKGVMHIYIREHTWRSENHFHHVTSIIKLGDSCLLARSPYQPPQTEILFFNFPNCIFIHSERIFFSGNNKLTSTGKSGERGVLGAFVSSPVSNS